MFVLCNIDTLVWNDTPMYVICLIKRLQCKHLNKLQFRSMHPIFYKIWSSCVKKNYLSKEKSNCFRLNFNFNFFSPWSTNSFKWPQSHTSLLFALILKVYFHKCHLYRYLKKCLKFRRPPEAYWLYNIMKVLFTVVIQK